jgi:dihydrofolate synthase / folylpolyglutamate synthase
MKFGLDGISRLLKQLKNPQRAFPAIHIAGTNGKGSTASMLAAMLTAAGYKTGLYTSPHLVNFEERIRVDGKMIPHSAVARLTDRLKGTIKKHQPTFFEATTAMAFSHFAEEGVDIAVVEAGLGGRLDSTNVLRPLCSVITNIGLEHTEILGDTVEKIAFEKAGIVKEGIPCVTAISEKGPLDVLKKVCRKNHAKLFLGTEYRAKVREAGLTGSIVDFAIDGNIFKNLFVSLAGHYQLSNLGVALTTVKVLKDHSGFVIDEEAVRSGLATVQKLTGLTGRLSVVHERPFVVADVAHNPSAIRNLCEAWKRLKGEKPILVFGVVKDKDYTLMVRQLARISDQAIAVAAHSTRSRPASDVAAAFEREGCETRAALSVEGGISMAIDLAGMKGTILVTGSHFVVGEALTALRRKRA